MYGDAFVDYTMIDEIRDLLVPFKDFYCAAMLKDSTESMSRVVRRFQVEVCDPMERLFFPNISRLYMWKKKWDIELRHLGWKDRKEKHIILMGARDEQVLVKMGEDDMQLVAPQDEDIEMGTRTLAGELLNDAGRMLRADQEMVDLYTNDELLKRRQYIVNVLGHTTKLAQGKLSLKLQEKKEKREDANFLLDLLARASSGNMTDKEMKALEDSVAHKEIAPEHQIQYAKET